MWQGHLHLPANSCDPNIFVARLAAALSVTVGSTVRRIGLSEFESRWPVGDVHNLAHPW
jgi:hypothetical protein